MDFSWLIPLLSLFTMLAVLAFAMVSKARTEERRHDPNAPKSSLAKDGPQGGVGFLRPKLNRYNVNPAPVDERARAARSEVAATPVQEATI